MPNFATSVRAQRAVRRRPVLYCSSAIRGTLQIARSSVRRQELWTTLAWAGIAERDPFASHTALLNLPPDAIDVHLLASYLTSCNRVEEALTLLQDARRFGDRSVETSKLLID